jgi:uncharacterized protein YjbI with pentapeptide repeats
LCLAHAAEQAPDSLDAELERIGRSGTVDARGVAIDGYLLARLLAAAPYEDDQTVFTAARFERATFENETEFDGVTFRGGVGFEGATFEDDVGFARATFQHGARFERATFGREATFEEADFQNDAVFERTTFEREVTFDRASFQGEAIFRWAVFRDNAEFRAATFKWLAVFYGTTFYGEAGFEDVTFEDDVGYDRAKFKGWARFDKTSFLGGAGFRLATFDDGAWFSRATFRDADFERASFLGEAEFDRATFQEATFQERAQFAQTTFQKGAEFDRAGFQGEAGFIKADFQGLAIFEGASFHADAVFEGASFQANAVFDRAIFQNAAFNKATFHGDAGFAGATFQRGAGFGGATFQSEAEFARATFKDEAMFAGATFWRKAEFARAIFERARQVGPLLAGKLVLDDAVFGELVILEAATAVLCARRARFIVGGQLRLRWAQVVLDDADLAAPVVLIGANHPFPEVAAREDRFAHRWERLPPGPRQQRWRPRLLSVRHAFVAGLALANVDLRACRFAGAWNLDQLRFEGTPLLAHTTGRWRARRTTLAEEQHWRAARLGRSRRAGWYPQACQPPASLSTEPEVLHPAALAELYRNLRTALVDANEDRVAADFQYGEMEMRRYDPSAPKTERLALWLYWLLSGYALRASRIFLTLLGVILVFAVLFHTFGFKDSGPEIRVVGVSATNVPIYRQVSPENRPSIYEAVDAIVYSAGTATLNAPDDRELTLAGRGLQVMLRILTLVLVALAGLARQRAFGGLFRTG